MVKKLWLVSVLLWWSVAASTMATAQTRLFAATDKKVIVLGEPLTVTVKTEVTGQPLSSLSLDRLKRDFNVYGLSSNSQNEIKNGRQIKSQTVTLTLYPLRTGRLQIPAFKIKGNSSRPLSVTVNEFGKHAPRVIIKAALDTQRPQVRQEATLILEIYDDSNLLWTAPREVVAASAHQRRLAETQRQEMLNGHRYTVHRYAWSIMPLREGGQSVVFPMVEASLLGKRLRYAVAPVWMDATAVPAYLPVHVPIGRPEVLTEPLPGEIALERPVNWTLTVQGSGISAEGLSKMLASVRSSDSLRFYPAQISVAGKEIAATAGQTLTVSLPFVPTRTGRQQLPDINVPYYDPVSARLESILIAGTVVEVFNPLWRTVKKVVLVLILLSVMMSLGYWMLKKLLREIKRRRQWLAISNARGAAELNSALLSFAAETAFLPCRTLQQWLCHMQNIYIVDNRLADVVQKITAAQYGEAAQGQNIPGLGSSIPELTRDISAMLKKLRNRKPGKAKEK